VEIDYGWFSETALFKRIRHFQKGGRLAHASKIPILRKTMKNLEYISAWVKMRGH
jgi:hypothetical protein